MATIERVEVLYCGSCGCPPEYCEYSPDLETDCLPWLQKNEPEVYKNLMKRLKKGDAEDEADDKPEKPTEPWTMEERLTKFYEKYQPDKVDSVPSLLEKYAGKEDKLFVALTKKYGPEPEDPYYASDDSDLEGDMEEMNLGDKKKRRGAAAKKENKADTRVIITKTKRNKKKAVTNVVGMETVPGIKLKDVSKALSKRFAGSSSVKDLPNGKKEIIVQGDHMDDVAALIVDKFNVPGNCVFLDIDGDFVPFSD